MDGGECGALSRAIEGVVERLGYECVHVGIKTDSAGQRVQVFIDSLGGIDISDCETVSKNVNRFLDELDEKADDGSTGESFFGLRGRYYLEVSSPGVERPLFTPEHYRRFRGREARLRLTEAMAGRKSLTGRIVTVDDVSVILHVEDEERDIPVPFGRIKSGNLVFRGFEPGKPRKRPGLGKARSEKKPENKHREEEL